MINDEPDSPNAEPDERDSVRAVRDCGGSDGVEGASEMSASAVIDVGPTIKNVMTISVHVRGVNRAIWRIRIATAIVRFAAWVGGVKFRVSADVDG